MTNVNSCTCVDHERPANHDKGCSPCIAKNLAEKCIPVCFYRKVDPDMDRKQDYSFKGFARYVGDREGK